jgi:hypothetical protein
MIENRVVETEGGESGLLSYPLDKRFSTIPQAEEAGLAEFKRRQSEGVRVSWNILDLDGRPCGPNGPAQ